VLEYIQQVFDFVNVVLVDFHGAIELDSEAWNSETCNRKESEIVVLGLNEQRR
jgi:hypothetical protein